MEIGLVDLNKSRRIIGAYRDEDGWTVGQSCVSITAYSENGEMSLVPYLKILFSDGREVRTCAKHYDVMFAEPDQNTTKNNGDK